MTQTAPHRAVLVLLAATVGGVLATLTGCGSGSLPSATSSVASLGTGRAAIMIHWPARDKATSRLIPTASQSIVVQIVRTVGGKPSVLQSQTVPRPADPTDGTAPISTVTFTNLPIDTFSVTATAYPTSTGTGTAQATGTGSVTTTADGNPASFSVIMDSTIDHLTLTPANPVLVIGKTLPLVATAYNGVNEQTASVVLVAQGKLAWSVSSVPDGAATVDGTGLVIGQTAGMVTVTVQDQESGKSVSTTIRVLTKLPVPDSVGPAQFNPKGDSYVGSLKADSAGTIPYVGGWNTVIGHRYVFYTGDAAAGSSGSPPTLVDVTANTVIAYGKLVTQTFGQDAKSITYAVFDFPGDITINSSNPGFPSYVNTIEVFR